MTEGESVRITAGLSHASSEDVTLDLSAAPIAPAVAGDGSLGSASTLTIADGEVEGDEYFAIELFLGEQWKFKPDAIAIMTILDAD